MPESRMDKSEVFYREGDSTNVNRNCGNCAFMLDDGDCGLVAGKVKPAMVCNLWSGAARSWQ